MNTEDRREVEPRVVYIWQWDPWPGAEFSDTTIPAADSVATAMTRHPQRPGPYKWCDETVPVRLIERTIVDRIVLNVGVPRG